MNPLDYPVPQPLLKYKIHGRFTGDNKQFFVNLADVPVKKNGEMFKRCIVNLEYLSISNIQISDVIGETSQNVFITCSLPNIQSFDNTRGKQNIITAGTIEIRNGTYSFLLTPLHRASGAFVSEIPYSGIISFDVLTDQGQPLEIFNESTVRYDAFLNLEFIE
jgi:hypothetical protein